MPKPAKYVAVYDVSDDKERERVSAVLEGAGFRIQESVFECLLTTRSKDKLKISMEKLGLQTGFVLLYRLNENAKRVEIGRVPENRFDDTHYAYVV